MVVRTCSRYFMFFLPAEYLCETTRTYECLRPDHRLFHRRAVGTREILGLTWDEIDEAGGVIRLSPARSKTLAPPTRFIRSLK